MNIMIFDTETISLNKPFCYNIGYVIFDTDSHEVITSKDYVVEQIWKNKELFSTAYYADKRPLYVSAMKGKKAIKKRYWMIMDSLKKDIQKYKVVAAYAYNSPFDINVFKFNCEWFKTFNPLEDIPVFDIRGYVMNKIAFTNEYKAFCENNNYFTEANNYSTTAENIYRFITKNTNFIESHTALSDSEIELQILIHCLALGAKLNTEYKVYKSVPRRTLKHIKVFKNMTLVYESDYIKRINKKDEDSIYLD